MAVWTLIAHDSLSLPATSVTWSSIPTDGTYDHLCIKVSARTDSSYVYDQYRIKLNSDSGTNYGQTWLVASTSTPSSARNTSIANYFDNIYGLPGSAVLADTFGLMECWIPNYANSANYKSLIAKGVMPNNSTTNNEWFVQLSAGLWTSTAAITTIVLSNGRPGGSDFVANSTFDLYGITGA